MLWVGATRGTAGRSGPRSARQTPETGCRREGHSPERAHRAAARLARSASRVLRVLQIQGETLGQQEDGDSLEAQVMVSLL